MQQSSHLIFPSNISIKVVGLANDTFEQAVYDCLKPLLEDMSSLPISKRYSKDKKYLSLTITVYATEREFIDAIYRAISACPGVIMAL
ncbi:MAG: YbeD family protein [Gammaproteobacteria bacterium]